MTMNPNQHNDQREGTKLPILLATASVLVGLISEPSSATNTVFLATTAEADAIQEVSLQQSDSMILYLRMNFDDTTVGGGVSLAYDPNLLRLDEFVFEDEFPDDAALRCPAQTPGMAPACPSEIGFVSFGSLLGLAGDRSVARLALTALATGTSTVGVNRRLPFSDVRGKGLVVESIPEAQSPIQLGTVVATLALLAAVRVRP